ncbi:MAG TPA: hypothetical protein VE130_09855 [Nitrososphaeraceae archaeon]|jgi:hypothetical protein|nr:hypothetical protein [Nitrososphaeraceae archaeon]
MLGDLIYEGNGRIIGQRIVAVEPRIKVENTILLDGRIHGNVNITDIGTFINTITESTIYHSEGYGLMTTLDGKEMVIWTAQGIHEPIKESDKSLFRGSAFYHTISKGKLAFLNNKMTIFESEVDNTGCILNKEWEWK